MLKGNALVSLEPLTREGMTRNPRKETARHEYFFSWSRWETFVGIRKGTARGGLFCIERI